MVNDAIAQQGQVQDQQQSQRQLTNVHNEGNNTNVRNNTTVDNTVSSTVSNEVSGSSSSTSSASNDGNSQSVTFTNPDDVTIRNVVSPNPPNSYPTSPCRIAGSGGLSLPGGALSMGGSIEDEECTLRETARTFRDLGVPEMGLYLLCKNSKVVVGNPDKDEEHSDPIGTTECLRLVRSFQGDPDDDTARLRAELDTLRREQQHLTSSLDKFRQECSDSSNRAFEACVSK